MQTWERAGGCWPLDLDLEVLLRSVLCQEGWRLVPPHWGFPGYWWWRWLADHSEHQSARHWLRLLHLLLAVGVIHVDSVPIDPVSLHLRVLYQPHDGCDWPWGLRRTDATQKAVRELTDLKYWSQASLYQDVQSWQILPHRTHIAHSTQPVLEIILSIVWCVFRAPKAGGHKCIGTLYTLWRQWESQVLGVEFRSDW